MRIRKVNTKNTVQYAIIQDITKNGKRTTKVYENIGNYEKLKLRAGDMEPLEWLNNYVKELNEKSKINQLPIIIKKYENKQIEKDEQFLFNGGYLFLQQIYYGLGLDTICEKIENKYRFKYNLNSILSNLIYGRILYPASKFKTKELCKKFLEQPCIEYNHILRGLEVISKESDFIQSKLYNNSDKYMKRNNKILYYDCTNFFFEIEEEDDLRKYGKSKENRPNPIVQMGLFMDGDGIPLSFDITPGNTNEQITLKPLEKKIINEFNMSNLVVCTDAGLASVANRKFNNTDLRKFITTQSIKKLKEHLKTEALDLSKGWKLPGIEKMFDISKLRIDQKLMEQFKNKTFYKERWINENGLEQRLIITFSVKYQEYQRHIRNKQIDRAKKLIEKNPKKIGKAKQNDPKRFITITNTTSNGEAAQETYYSINNSAIEEEAKYDGLYAVCTNLEDSVEDIIKVNHRRWEIEESFRIMKNEFKSRPVHLSREDRIKAHFITCFLSLVIYRFLEKKTDEKYTVSELLETLRNMYFYKEKNVGYFPAYTRTDITDLLHEKFGFRTDYEIITENNFEKILKQTKK